MKVLTCGATRRRLQAFHDDELQIADQIAVSAHLEWCDTCAATFAELRLLRAALRSAAPGRIGLSDEEDASLQSAIVSRVSAEETFSFSAQMRELFGDMHLVYTGLGAAFATLVFAVSLFTAMSPVWPGSNQNPVPIDARVLMPRPLDQAFSTKTNSIDTEAVFMLAAIVTREGTVANLELLHATSGQPVAPGTAEAKAAESLMGAVSKARFEPARVDGLPVAVNMVWLVTNTTVRASEETIARRPVAKRPIA